MIHICIPKVEKWVWGQKEGNGMSKAQMTIIKAWGPEPAMIVAGSYFSVLWTAAATGKVGGRIAAFQITHYNDVIMSAMASQITGLLGYLLNRLFRRRSKRPSKLRVTSLCEGNSPVTGEFPEQRASDAEMFPFDDVIMEGDLNVRMSDFCSVANRPPTCVRATRFGCTHVLDDYRTDTINDEEVSCEYFS